MGLNSYSRKKCAAQTVRGAGLQRQCRGRRVTSHSGLIFACCTTWVHCRISFLTSVSRTSGPPPASATSILAAAALMSSSASSLRRRLPGGRGGRGDRVGTGVRAVGRCGGGGRGAARVRRHEQGRGHARQERRGERELGLRGEDVARSRVVHHRVGAHVGEVV